MSESSPETKKGPRASRWVLVISGLGLGAWWLVSILLHTALFGVVYVASPGKPPQAGDADFAMTISPNRVRDIVEEIRDAESERFEDRVEELAKIKEELDRLNAEKIEQYNEIMREEAANVPDVLTTAADSAESAQKEALAAQAKADEALGKMQNAHAKSKGAGSSEEKQAADAEAAAAATEAQEAQAAVELAQRKVAAAQSKIGEQLQLLGDSPDAQAAHTAATDSQAIADKTQQNAEGVLDKVGSARKSLDKASQVAAKEQAALDRVKGQAEAAEANLAARKEALSTAETGLEQAKTENTTEAAAAAEADAALKKTAEEAKRLANELKAVNEALKKEKAALAKLQQETKRAEDAVKTNQDSAAKQQKKVEELAATPGELLTKEQTALEKVQAQVANAEAALKAKNEALAATQQKISELETAAASDTTESSSLAAASAAAAEEKKRLANEAKLAAENLKKQEAAANKAKKDLAAAEGQMKKIQETLAKQQAKTDEATVASDAREKSVDDTVALTSVEQQNSIEAQKQSLEKQVAAKGAIAKATSSFNADQAGNAMAEEATVIPLEKPAEGDSLAELYDKARLAEEAVAETFKNLRAAELAAIRKIPLSEALKLTEVATPDRPELNTEILSSDISDVKGVREQEKAINAAADQMESMVALADRMKELATGTGAELSVAQIKAQSAANERMEQLAMEDSGMQAKDLSGAMSGAHGAAGAAMMQLHANLGISTAAAAWGVNPMNPNSLAQLAQMMRAASMLAAGGGGMHGMGPGTTPGAYGGQGYGPEGGLAGGVPGIVGVSTKEYKPLHGRTVRSGMVSAEPNRNPAWLYVDTWYIIGPWPNPGRKNLNTKFPPETVVDLDAVYQGGRKSGAPIPVRWEFFQLPYVTQGKDRSPGTGMIRPPGMQDYEIFYAYTELWFDQASDLWVAIGSDDQSKVWINDQLVWKSGDEHKSWIPNEGLRKVHFRKGINRVLYRLENGQHSGGFSFLVCLSEPK